MVDPWDTTQPAPSRAGSWEGRREFYIRAGQLLICPSILLLSSDLHPVGYSLLMRSIIPYDENPALRKVAREIPVADITGSTIQELIADMKALLSKEDYGVALAAPQLGESIRLFIVSGKAVAKRERSSKRRHVADVEEAPDAISAEDMVFINPVMTKLSRGKRDKHEGCLSIRGKWGVVPRTEKATVRALDEHGHEFTRGASGLLAHIFQHEMDHLEGILYTDKANEIYDDKPESDE